MKDEKEELTIMISISSAGVRPLNLIPVMAQTSKTEMGSAEKRKILELLHQKMRASRILQSSSMSLEEKRTTL